MESWDSVILYSLCVSNVDMYLRSSCIPNKTQYSFSDSNVQEMTLSSFSMKTFLKSTGNTARHVFV